MNNNLGHRAMTRRLAFTLIELMVVVAIIALLISILLPSLAQAREQAKRAKCLANLRSIGQAVQTCFNENRGYGPTWDDGDQIGNNNYVMLTWLDVLYDLDYLGASEAGLCPSDRRPDGPAERRGAEWLFQFVDKFGVGERKKFGVRGSYAINSMMNYNWQEDKYAGDSARQIFALDGWWNWFGDFNAAWMMRTQVWGSNPDPVAWPNWEATMCGWRHGNQSQGFGCDLLYLDWHATTVWAQRPGSNIDLLRRTTDTARSFTWLPGEYACRYDYDTYIRPGDPNESGEIDGYGDEWPTWAYHLIDIDSGYKTLMGGDKMPPDYPDELSCNWRTASKAWRKFAWKKEDRY